MHVIFLQCRVRINVLNNETNISNSISLFACVDGGWGLQVSENVAAGDLLFASNPAAVVSSRSVGPSLRFLISVGPSLRFLISGEETMPVK